MTEQVSTPDIAAFRDVLLQLQEEAQNEGMSTERAAELMELLGSLGKEVGDTIALLKSRAIISLEGQARMIGDKVYASKPTGKWRPNHHVIQARTVEAALHDENGERIGNTEAVAWRAVKLYHELYVAPKSKPKEEGLRAIRMNKKDAAYWENTGRELIVTDLSTEEHE